MASFTHSELSDVISLRFVELDLSDFLHCHKRTIPLKEAANLLRNLSLRSFAALNALSKNHRIVLSIFKELSVSVLRANCLQITMVLKCK